MQKEADSHGKDHGDDEEADEGADEGAADGDDEGADEEAADGDDEGADEEAADGKDKEVVNDNMHKDMTQDVSPEPLQQESSPGASLETSPGVSPEPTRGAFREVFDPLRRRYVRRTPEEVVRQGVIVWLAQTVGAPLSLMASEYGFNYNGRRYRADIVVFDRSLKPLMLVECKAPDVAIDSSVVEQAVRYNRVLDVRYIMVTNGKTSYLCSRKEGGVFEQSAAFPTYEQMLASKTI